VTALEAIILGAIQGLTEFIPISSSAHLLIVRWAFGWEAKGVAFDAVIHLGTLLALFLFFGREWYAMVGSYLSTTRLARRKASASTAASTSAVPGILLWPMVLACIPAGLTGLLFDHVIEGKFRNAPVLTGVLLIAMGVVLYLADRMGRKSRPMHAVRTRDWLFIGIAQALAVIPGVSRSGITITAGLMSGLEREAAARFSFLIGAPVILGAGVWELHKVMKAGLSGSDLMPLVLGVLTSTIVGYACIKFLIEYLRKRSTALFVVYRVVLGVGVIAAYMLGHLKV
jgi:undecaprenyl-diphosphatase